MPRPGVNEPALQSLEKAFVVTRQGFVLRDEQRANLGQGFVRRGCRGLHIEWDVAAEDAALALDALDADSAPHQLDELLCDGRAEAGSAVALGGVGVFLGEALEDAV